MATSSKKTLAEALAMAPDNPTMSEPGLEQPPEMKALAALNSVGQGYSTGQMGATIAKILAAKAVPALSKLGEAGAIFPEAGRDVESLPLMESGAKQGDPHALYAYKDNFGPNMTERKIFNVFGDPAHPAIKKVGWGSSVPEEVLQQAGIPIVGKQIPKLRTAFK